MVTASTSTANATAFVLVIAIIMASFYSSRHLHFDLATEEEEEEEEYDNYDDVGAQQQKQQPLIDDYEARIAKLEETRRAERTGRIRAEMKLRSLLKTTIGGVSGVTLLDLNGEENELELTKDAEIDGGNCHGGRDDDASTAMTTRLLQQVDDFNRSRSKRKCNETRKNLKMHHEQHHQLLQLQNIGTIVSPYTKRMGTPRQGALVPSGRGYVQLTNIPMECLEGMECYSHAWIIFSFHANTDVNNNVRNNATDSNNGRSNNSNSINSNSKKNTTKRMMIPLSKTKIRPPRGNGIKVGMLATRSPHRPNNIGLSLVRITHLDTRHKRLHITALDLVHGTPVYDIKPVVPWDIPGQYDNIPLVVPNYVRQDGDTIDTVQFTTKAQHKLEMCVRGNKLSPLYTTENNGFQEARNTICQILAQDPRASNTNGPNKRGSSTSTATTASNCPSATYYKMLFCSVEIEFQVRSNSENSGGGGGEGDNGEEGKIVVIVETVNDNLDLTNVEYIDGIPILLK